MTKQGLTAKQIEHMTSDRRREIPVGTPRRLYLAIYPGGRKAWTFRYRWRGGHKKITFGRYPAMSLAAARAEATAAIEELKTGKDPAAMKAEENREPNSAEAVAEEWLLRDVTRTRTAKEAERILRKEILPVCGRKLITEVGRADALRLIDAIMDRGTPSAANAALEIFKRFLNWAVNRGHIPFNPIANLKRPAQKKSRDRVLSDDELREVWLASKSLGYPNGPFLRLLLLSGQRRAEVAKMTWGEVDLPAAMWTLSAERTKSRRIHDTPLSKPAIEILKGLPRFGAGLCVFSTTSGAKPIAGFSKLAARLDAEITKRRREAGIEEPMQPFVLHDFRRSAASHLAKGGVAAPVLSALLNHSAGTTQGVLAVYNRHRYSDERRAALERWAEHVTGLAKQAKRRAS